MYGNGTWPDWQAQEDEWRENRGWHINANEMQMFYCIIVPGRCERSWGRDDHLMMSSERLLWGFLTLLLHYKLLDTSFCCVTKLKMKILMPGLFNFLTGRIKNIANLWNSSMSFKHSTISCTSMLPYLFLYFLTLLSMAPDRIDITPPCRNGYLTLMPGNLLECPTRRWWGDSILLSLSLSIYCIGQERVINKHTYVGTQIQGSFVRMANLMVKDCCCCCCC